MSDDKKSRILAAARSVFLRYGYKRVNSPTAVLKRDLRRKTHP